MGFRAAWSLDLTTVDPVDGQPGHFSFEVKRKRAIELLERGKPLLFMACPMCGPLCALQKLTYAKLSKKEVKAKLRDAMAHVKFALDMCLRQYLEWRFFVFERPTSASSWATAMLKHVMRLKGVHTARFESCQLGMETVDAAGKKQAAKKRTTVMTNSANLAEVLRQAQRKGLRKHQRLVGGRVSACQVYPQQFVELIVEAIKKELQDAIGERAWPRNSTSQRPLRS